MLMVFNSKLNLCTYLAQGNLYKNSNAIEQAFFFFFARLTQYTFLSKRTEYFNTVTQRQLLFMPLKGNVQLELRSFLLCFSNLYLFALSHTNRTQSQRVTFLQRHHFCWITHTQHQQEVFLDDRQTPSHQERIITHISAANQVWDCAEQQKNTEVENNTVRLLKLS